MAENFSIERRRLMRYLGARVVLTPASRMGSGMLSKAQELADEHGWFLCRQFVDDANADIHSATTAAEILSVFPSGSLDYFVTGFGTGGTLKGIARELRKHSPGTRIIATEPDNSPVVASGIAQQFTEAGDPAKGHPAFRPHLMQGWAPDFMSKLTHDAISDGLIDEVQPVAGSEALAQARELARQEGIFCGITGGATFAGALAVAQQVPAFGTAPKATHRAVEFMDSVVTSPDEPMVMFSLEWCEFCWSVRKLFKALGLHYRTIDLDSVEYQADNFGSELRVALQERTGKSTIPQLFFAGEHLGGCTETFEAFNEGRFQALLSQRGVTFREDVAIDPYSLLPGWLHPR